MDYLLKSSAIIFIFYVCYTLFLQRDTFFESNRWFLLLGLIIASCIPLIVIPIYIEYNPVPFSEFTVTNTSGSPTPIQEEQFNYLQLLSWIYLSGLIFFIGKLTIEILSLKRILKAGSLQSYGNFKLIETNKQVAPFSFFNYIVYNPNQFNKTELEHVINHEKAHTQQFHSIDTIIAQIACVLLWFNPFIWLYKRALQQNLEFIADQKAQYISPCKKSYQTVLLKASVKNHQLVFTNNFYTSLIKKRIIMLHKSKSKKLNQLKLIVVLPLLALFIMSFNTENIYVDSSSYENKNQVFDSEEIIEIIITKNTSDEGLIKIKEVLKSKGITLNYSDVKRNSDGEITSISTEFKSDKNSSNYNISGDDGIKSFRFKSSEDAFSVGTVDKNNFVYKAKNGNVKMQSTNGSRKVIIINENDENDTLRINTKSLKGRDTIFIQKNNKFTFSTDDEDSNIFINESDEPIFIINGKKVKKSFFEDVDSDDIHSVFIFKGEKALEKYGNEGKNGVIVMTKKGSNNIFTESEDNVIMKSKSEFRFETDGDEPLFILNGKVINKNEMDGINPNEIESVDVLKDKNAAKAYGKKGENGVIIINTKKASNLEFNKLNSEKQLLLNDNYLYVLDGKEISKPELLKVYSKASISNLSILKGEGAKKKYGGKGLNGVVEVTSKSKNSNSKADNKTFIFTSKDNNSPWRIDTSVTSVQFYDNEWNDLGMEFVITKDISDAFLGKLKNDFKAHDIDAKFTKVRRNKAGEITSIKISLDDNQGRKSSASWKEKNQAIPDVVMGKTKDDKLFVRAIGN